MTAEQAYDHYRKSLSDVGGRKGWPWGSLALAEKQAWALFIKRLETAQATNHHLHAYDEGYDAGYAAGVNDERDYWSRNATE